MSEDEKHINYFDILRGIAIVFVIINHSYSGNPLAGTLKEDLYLLLRQLVIPAVPIFLAESGFFLAKKELHNKKEYLSFVFNHSFRIWLPMAIWSIPLFLTSDHHNHLLYFIIFMLVGGYSIYYFITLIIQYYLMQPILKKVNLGGGIFVTCNHVFSNFCCMLCNGNSR